MERGMIRVYARTRCENRGCFYEWRKRMPGVAIK